MSKKWLAGRRLGLEPLEARLMMNGSSITETDSGQQWISPPGLVSSAVPQSIAQDQLDHELVAALGRSINNFALDLYAELQKGCTENLFFSPYSISMALTMALAGARGQTATEMANALHLDIDQDALHRAAGSLLADLNAAGEVGGYELAVSNALWGQIGAPFRQEFLDLLRSSYESDLQNVDFAHDAEGVRKTINDCVARQTHDRIKNLIPQGVITKFTRFVLTNAIYFKGQWASEFAPEQTRDAAFKLSSGERILVPTMHKSGSYRYAERDGFQALELPYAGDRLSMVVFLPTGENGSLDLDANPLPADLDQWLRGLCWEENVVVSLPKFKMETAFNLNEVLQALGNHSAFSAAADFSGISDESWAISNVLHKAFVEVNESGTEAAAATAIVGITTTIYHPFRVVQFKADHPFHFIIRDNVSGAVLFMGRVMNPVPDGSAPPATEPDDDVSAGPGNPPTNIPLTPQPILVTKPKAPPPAIADPPQDIPAPVAPETPPVQEDTPPASPQLPGQSDSPNLSESDDPGSASEPPTDNGTAVTPETRPLHEDPPTISPELPANDARSDTPERDDGGEEIAAAGAPVERPAESEDVLTQVAMDRAVQRELAPEAAPIDVPFMRSGRVLDFLAPAPEFGLNVRHEEADQVVRIEAAPVRLTDAHLVEKNLRRVDAADLLVAVRRPFESSAVNWVGLPEDGIGDIPGGKKRERKGAALIPGNPGVIDELWRTE